MEHHLEHGPLLLIASIAVLALAPALYRLAGRRPRIAAIVDSGVRLGTVGLVLFAVLPEATKEAGDWAVLAAMGGAVLPLLWEARRAHWLDGIGPWLFSFSIAAHAMTDGLAMAGAELPDGHLHGLSGAVLLHRIPVAVSIWWLLAPRGNWAPIAGLGLIGLGSVVGYGLGAELLGHAGHAHVAVFQAAAGGLLLHTLLHRPIARVVEPVLPWAVGSLFAFAAVWTALGAGSSISVLALTGIGLWILGTAYHRRGPSHARVGH